MPDAEKLKKMIQLNQILSSKLCNEIMENYPCISDIGVKLINKSTII